MRRWSVVLAVSVMVAAIGGVLSAGRVNASPQPCAGATTRILEPAAGLASWAENLTYDRRGDLWVTRSLQNVAQRLDRHGRVTATVPVRSPGAIRTGPDGKLYVTSGDSSENMLPGTPLTGTVVRFDPQSPHPRSTVFARDLGMPNGLAFDPATGDAYVSDSRLGVLRLDRHGRVDRQWSSKAPQNLAPDDVVDGTGVNGAVIDGSTLYVTLTSSLTGRVLAVPLDDPARTRAVADLTAPLPGFLDDLAVVGDHRLAVATTLGRLYLVDPRTGRSCGIDVGAPLTSVAVSPADSRRLTVASETGAIYAVRL